MLLGFQLPASHMLKAPERYHVRSKDNWQSRLMRLLPHALIIGLIVLLINITLRYLWIYPMRMLHKAMEPSIMAGEIFFLQEKKIESLKHQQIVRVEHPLGGQIFCRVVAIEGETVTIKDGKLYITSNPTTLSTAMPPQPVFPSDMSTRDNLAPVIIRPGFFFCLHDNRIYINDSRTFGPFELRHITGIVRFHQWLGSTI